MITKRALLYITTLSYLRPTQILSLIRKRLLPSFYPNSRISDVRQRLGVKFWAGIPASRTRCGDYSFCFLNQTKEFPDGQVDWTSKEMSKLWRYNLHYFDYLLHADRSLDAKTNVIASWIKQNPPGSVDAWEPYTVSLRIVNWVKFFLQNSAHPNENSLHSLYTQALWLEKNIEYHLLANHYLKNGVALFFAGMYFAGADADRWLAKGREILTSEVEEQFLADGGHYERSPMYHAISVADYLDVLNLATSSCQAETFLEIQQFKIRINKALEFLDDICLPDGDIPLFNDSALGIAPHPGFILAYGNQITAYHRKSQADGLSIKSKSHTGYYVLRDGADMLIIDCGAVGPNYQPGHAHSDTLSFVLALNGERTIVDTGVYDYESGPRRLYARGTGAHNTVKIDGQDQSEVWGVFRVGRRAYPLCARLSSNRCGHATFEGAHDGYARLPGRLIHKRTIDYTAPGKWTIRDMVDGSGLHMIESYLHIHPSCRVIVGDRSVEILNTTGQAVLTITPDPKAQVTIKAGYYFPEFGKEQPNSVLVMTYSGEVPITLTCLMTKPPPKSSYA